MEIQIYLSLMQPLCQISKKLYGKSKPCNNLRRRSEIIFFAMLESTEIRNNIINISLPLMIFIRMHSQESQFHDKCLICSIKSIIYVQIPPFCSRIQYSNPNAQALGPDKVKTVILQFVETCQTMYIINLQDVVIINLQ